MVRTIKRANDGEFCRNRIFSQLLIWSQRQLNSHAREELEEKSILLLSVWRGTQLTFSRPIPIMTLFRGGYISSREISWCGTSDRCPGCRALISGGRAQGHTEDCRNRVEGELRKTEEGKARLRAAASRLVMLPRGVH